MFSVSFPVSRPHYKLFSPGASDYILGRVVEADNFYEHDLLDLLGGVPLREGVIVDAGANIGNHSLYFAKVMGRHVLAFEASSKIRGALSATVAANSICDNVDVFGFGLSSQSGTRTLALHRDNLGMSKIVDAGMSEELPSEFDACELVQVERLDDVVGGADVALLKVDVEGHEVEVLEGAADTLARCRPLLCVEMHGSRKVSQVDELLGARDYRVLSAGGRSRNFVFCHLTQYDKLASYVRAVFDHRVARSTDHLLSDLRRAQAELSGGRAEIERLRAMNASLYSRVAKAESVALQARSDLAATGKTIKPVDVERRAADLQLYKAKYSESVAEVVVWKERAMGLKAINDEIGLRYRTVTAQVTSERERVKSLEQRISELEAVVSSGGGVGGARTDRARRGS